MAKKRKVERVKKKERSDKVPTGIKIISVLHYIGAVLSALFGLLLVIGANAIVSYLITAAPELAAVRYGTLLTIGVILGILLIGIGVLAFFIGRGLWRLRQWARIIVIIFAILGVLSNIVSIFTNFEYTNIVSLVIDGFIAGYLLFNGEVKKVFK